MMLCKTKITFGFQILLSLILGGVIFWFYWPILAILAEALFSNEDYSFGLLLPFVSGYIICLKWKRIIGISRRPSLWGFAVIAFGLLLFLVGELATDLYIPCLSFIILLAGLLLLFGGREIVKEMIFPLLLLVLMIPLPFFVTQKLTLPLQLISSQIATGFLHALGIPVVRQGNILDLGVRQLQVVSACSGLRYILSLFALVVIFCYFYQRQIWKVCLLLASIIPAAIIANALRIAGMAIFPSMQEGFLHTLSGWLIFVFCFGFLGLLNSLLKHFDPQGPSEEPAPSSDNISKKGEHSKPPYTLYLIATLALVMLAGLLAQCIAYIPSVPLRQSFDNFPLQLGPWQGRHVYIDPAMVRATGCNAYLNTDYHNPQKELVSLWIAYYENQKGGASAHSPFSCLTGGGWDVKESEILEISPGLPVRSLLMDQGGNLLLVYYWYLQRNRWLTNEYFNKFYLAYDRLVSRQADGALVRLITPVGRDLHAAHERLTSFSRLLVPVLPEFIKE